MPNGIYALADPSGVGGTCSINQNIDVKTDDNTKFWATTYDILEKYCDEPVIGTFYEEHKLGIAIAWGIAAVLVVGALAVAATVVTGGAAAGIAVVATAAVVGAVSAGINVASQKLNGAEEIDWCKVAISGFAGAISGAVAACPATMGVQMAVNGGINGLQSLSTGGTANEIVQSTSLGILAGAIGGSGPSWHDTNIFVPSHIDISHGITYCPTVGRQAGIIIKNIWTGLDSSHYIIPQFSGIFGGFVKSTVLGFEVSNFEGINNYAGKLWDKYKPDWCRDDDEKEEENAEPATN